MSFTPRALICSVAAVVAPGGGPTIVRTQSTNPSNGTNRTVTITAPASGNSLFVLVKGGSGVVTGLTDDQSNTYTKDYDASTSRQVWRCHNVTNAPVTLMFTNTTDVIKVRVLEVSGLANAAPSVAGGETTSASSLAAITRSHTTLVANALVMGWLYHSTAVTTTAALPSGAVDIPAVGGNDSFHGYYYVKAAAGALTVEQDISSAVTNLFLSSISYAP